MRDLKQAALQMLRKATTCSGFEPAEVVSCQRRSMQAVLGGVTVQEVMQEKFNVSEGVPQAHSCTFSELCSYVGHPCHTERSLEFAG